MMGKGTAPPTGDLPPQPSLGETSHHLHVLSHSAASAAGWDTQKRARRTATARESFRRMSLDDPDAGPGARVEQARFY